ncbi:MAG: hypothetical protein E5X80_04850 [Mesorhizobium sp.]|uniref:hypothetical protein n=1 Tax=Mesorhizobium sp. TaxID=1871066 RepID=UPI000FE8E14A|nr:hypothetical protein [Mesorhizobium sp.]RWM06258.1 MAG: hypothetical protein EOR71_20760 [Mesorhizobium sp.]TIO53005.1 MAG: hypothetical protein E5X78_10195 [Mesorhizobium sp.]TIO61840.1 MAG: hypothetical protein E5X79_05585 [Mesorhizobium sp.]TJV66707.1 MAG: hypothetical protein E5X80_04850 [Mesorhizobium sp.]
MHVAQKRAAVLGDMHQNKDKRVARIHFVATRFSAPASRATPKIVTCNVLRASKGTRGAVGSRFRNNPETKMQPDGALRRSAAGQTTSQAASEIDA